jgi:hypothetical protein
VQACQFALDIEEPVAVSGSVPGGDTGADRVAGGLPGEPFTNGIARLCKFSSRLVLERQSRGRRVIGRHHIQARNSDDDGTQQALPKHRFVHSVPLSGASCAVSRLRLDAATAAFFGHQSV